MIECAEEYPSSIASGLGKDIEDMDMESIERTAHIIVESGRQGGRIHITGTGKPGHMAGYVMSLLSFTGTNVYELCGTKTVHGFSGQVKKGDAMIAISDNGETMELETIAQTLIANGAYIISCTGNPQSALAKQSGVCLVTHVGEEEGTLSRPPHISVLSEIPILQCLSIALQEAEKLDLNQYAR